MAWAGLTEEWWWVIFHLLPNLCHIYEKQALTGGCEDPVHSSNTYMPEWRYVLPSLNMVMLSLVMVLNGFFCTKATKYSSVSLEPLMCSGERRKESLLPE